jgi:hypothetical protein
MMKIDIDGLFSKIVKRRDGGCYVYPRRSINEHKLHAILGYLGHKWVETVDSLQLDRIQCTECQMPMNYARSFNKKLYCNKCLDSKVNDMLLMNPTVTDMIQKIASKKIMARLSESAINDTIQCVGCNEIFVLEGSFSIRLKPQKDILGDDLVDSNLIDHYNKHRIRCTKCLIEFCKGCRKINYHTGFTCDQYELYLKSPKCKFCLGTLIDGSCKKEVCKGYERLSQRYTLDCGHDNYGFDKYELCLDCPGIKGDDCYICMTDRLSDAPCIKMDCGHVFHKGCIDEKFRIKHSTKHVTMNYTTCPVCYYRLSHETIDGLIGDMQKDNLAIERLTMEHIKDYNLKVPVKEMVGKLRFFRCDDCSKIYFGGEAVCGDDPDAGEGDVRKHLCPNCDSIGKQSCHLHGTEYMIFKCSYCCMYPCVFNCFVTAYFCDTCHQTACSIKPAPCPGKELCILEGNHPPNSGKGMKHAIGCAMCLPPEFLRKIKWKFPGRY